MDFLKSKAFVSRRHNWWSFLPLSWIYPPFSPFRLSLQLLRYISLFLFLEFPFVCRFRKQRVQTFLESMFFPPPFLPISAWILNAHPSALLLSFSSISIASFPMDVLDFSNYSGLRFTLSVSLMNAVDHYVLPAISSSFESDSFPGDRLSLQSGSHSHFSSAVFGPSDSCRRKTKYSPLFLNSPDSSLQSPSFLLVNISPASPPAA